MITGKLTIKPEHWRFRFRIALVNVFVERVLYVDANGS